MATLKQYRESSGWAKVSYTQETYWQLGMLWVTLDTNKVSEEVELKYLNFFIISAFDFFPQGRSYR
jgi:hypothetical protein